MPSRDCFANLTIFFGNTRKTYVQVLLTIFSPWGQERHFIRRRRKEKKPALTHLITNISKLSSLGEKPSKLPSPFSRAILTWKWVALLAPNGLAADLDDFFKTSKSQGVWRQALHVRQMIVDNKNNILFKKRMNPVVACIITHGSIPCFNCPTIFGKSESLDWLLIKQTINNWIWEGGKREESM